MSVQDFNFYALSVMTEGFISGEPNFCQTFLDMMHVDAPSSMTHWQIVIFFTDTGIWKVTMEGSLGVALFKSKSIRCVSARSIAPNIESRAFCHFGHDFKTSKADMAAGDYAKSSIML